MTSTMKSEPSGPAVFANSFGVPVSAAAIWAWGGSGDGRGDGAVPATGAVAARASSCGDTAVAAPVTATPAMNFRRLTFGPLSLRAESFARSLRAMSSSLVTPQWEAIDRFAPAGHFGANG